MPSVREALNRATKILSVCSDTPRLDAELLAACALNMDRNSLILTSLDVPEPAGFEDFVARRLKHEPVAYISGERDFWTLTLRVAPGVLIPRSDSETLIEAAIAYFGEGAPRSILDLGTGSGALLLAALSQWSGATGVGVDASNVALDIARANAERLQLAKRTLLRRGNWAEGIEAQFDLVLCNPPYVETGADLERQVRDYEPASALFAGADGLDDYRRLAPQIGRVLAPTGCAVVEIGSTQGEAVSTLFAAHGLDVVVKQDLGARDRCLVLTHRV
jgi:release factor glutamine methyltransferase